MADTILINGQTMIIKECQTCGVLHTFPKIIHDNRYRDGGYWHCPNGHQWGWKEGNEEREAIRLERDRLKQQAAQKDDEIRQLRFEMMHVEMQRDEAKAKHVNARKRAGAGMCPCCKRTFSQVARHMKTKHPAFKAEAIN